MYAKLVYVKEEKSVLLFLLLRVREREREREREEKEAAVVHQLTSHNSQSN